MSKIFLHVVFPEDLSEKINSLEKANEIAFSRRQPAESAAEPLNASITGMDPTLMLQLITAAFSTATAFITFVSQLLPLLKKEEKAVQISNPETGRTITVTGDTDVEILKSLIDHV